MSLKGEGDFSGIGGKRQGYSYQTSVPSLLSGPDRGVCLLEDDPDPLPLQHDRKSSTGYSSVSLHTLFLSCLSRPAIQWVILEAHSRVDSFLEAIFLPHLSPSIKLSQKSLIILCYMVNYCAWWGVIAGIVIISFKVWRTWLKSVSGASFWIVLFPLLANANVLKTSVVSFHFIWADVILMMAIQLHSHKIIEMYTWGSFTHI